MRTPNNRYLREIADSVDSDGATDEKLYNNDYLKRIAEGIGEFTRQEVDVSRLSGVISEDNLPSYVDDVVEGYYHGGAFYEDPQHQSQMAGETGKIYVDLSTYDSYRWSGSVYARVSSPIETATQSEAENGTDTAKYMTPLRVKQAIGAQVTGLTSEDLDAIKAAM